MQTTGFRHHFKNDGVAAPDNLGGLGPFHAADFDRQFNPPQAASVGGLITFLLGKISLSRSSLGGALIPKGLS